MNILFKLKLKLFKLKWIRTRDSHTVHFIHDIDGNRYLIGNRYRPWSWYKKALKTDWLYSEPTRFAMYPSSENEITETMHNYVTGILIKDGKVKLVAVDECYITYNFSSDPRIELDDLLIHLATGWRYIQRKKSP